MAFDRLEKRLITEAGVEQAVVLERAQDRRLAYVHLDELFRAGNELAATAFAADPARAEEDMEVAEGEGTTRAALSFGGELVWEQDAPAHWHKRCNETPAGI